MLIFTSIHISHHIHIFPGTQSVSVCWIPGCSFPEVKRPERGDEHSPPSSVCVKNAWGIVFTCLHAFTARCSPTLPSALKCFMPAVSAVTPFVWVSVTDVRSTSKGANTAVAFLPPGAEQRWLARLSLVQTILQQNLKAFFTEGWSIILIEFYTRTSEEF
jgi:hypothetical protein